MFRYETQDCLGQLDYHVYFECSCREIVVPLDNLKETNHGCHTHMRLQCSCRKFNLSQDDNY